MGVANLMSAMSLWYVSGRYFLWVMIVSILYVASLPSSVRMSYSPGYAKKVLIMCLSGCGWHKRTHTELHVDVA